jgi:flagellar capping protein FliD
MKPVKSALHTVESNLDKRLSKLEERLDSLEKRLDKDKVDVHTRFDQIQSIRTNWSDTQ